MIRSTTSSTESLLLRDARRDAKLLARQSDVEDADLVAQSVAVNPERARGAAEISGRSLHGSDDVLLLEFFFCELERDSVGEELVNDLLELPIQVHDAPPRNQFE